MPAMTIELRFFASVREQLGCSTETVTVPAEVQTVGQLRAWLLARGGIWAQALNQSLRTACDQAMCDDAAVLSEGVEVAFFPPVTGG